MFGNWWHTGSLPGTSTETVRAMNGYGWSVFLNSRPDGGRSAAFGQRLDGDFWKPIVANVPFLQGDLFDQYGVFTGWKSAADHAAAAAQAAGMGQYASRLEGRPGGEYRAQWVRLPSGAKAESAVGLDCTSFVGRDAALAGQGYARANLQTFFDGGGARRFQGTWVKQ